MYEMFLRSDKNVSPSRLDQWFPTEDRPPGCSHAVSNAAASARASLLLKPSKLSTLQAPNPQVKLASKGHLDLDKEFIPFI